VLPGWMHPYGTRGMDGVYKFLFASCALVWLRGWAGEKKVSSVTVGKGRYRCCRIRVVRYLCGWPCRRCVLSLTHSCSSRCVLFPVSVSRSFSVLFLSQYFCQLSLIVPVLFLSPSLSLILSQPTLYLQSNTSPIPISKTPFVPPRPSSKQSPIYPSSQVPILLPTPSTPPPHLP
jgi:hypothetical protein